MRTFIAAVLCSIATAANVKPAPPKAFTLDFTCPGCLFEGFMFCASNAANGLSSCVTKEMACPANTAKMLSMSQCKASYFTSSVSSNCGSTTTITDAALAPEEPAGKLKFKGVTKQFTVEPKKSCRVSITSAFSAANSAQNGTFGLLLPNDNVYYMVTKEAWTNAATTIDAKNFNQLE